MKRQKMSAPTFEDIVSIYDARAHALVTRLTVDAGSRGWRMIQASRHGGDSNEYWWTTYADEGDRAADEVWVIGVRFVTDSWQEERFPSLPPREIAMFVEFRNIGNGHVFYLSKRHKRHQGVDDLKDDPPIKMIPLSDPAKIEACFAKIEAIDEKTVADLLR